MRIEITTSTGAKILIEPGCNLTDLATCNREFLFEKHIPCLIKALAELEKEAGEEKKEASR